MLGHLHHRGNRIIIAALLLLLFFQQQQPQQQEEEHQDNNFFHCTAEAFSIRPLHPEQGRRASTTFRNKSQKTNHQETIPTHSTIRMEQTYQDLARRAIQHWQQLQQQQEQQQDTTTTTTTIGTTTHRQPLWIAIVGAPGSGKTTVAQAVAKEIDQEIQRLNQQQQEQQQTLDANHNNNHNNNAPLSVPRAAAVVPMDGYHYTQKYYTTTLQQDMRRRGAPWSFDAETMGRDLTRAKENMSMNANNDDNHPTACHLPSYDRTISDPRPGGIVLQPQHHDIVLVEGLYLLLASLTGTCRQELPLGKRKDDDDAKNETEQQQQLTMLEQAIAMIPEWNDNDDNKDPVERALAEFQRWQPLLDIWDDTWFVAPPTTATTTTTTMTATTTTTGSNDDNPLQRAFAENKRRLVERSLLTWTDKKTRLWSTIDIVESSSGAKAKDKDEPPLLLTAREAAGRRVDYNDVKNGALVTCCQSHVQVQIVTQ